MCVFGGGAGGEIPISFYSRAGGGGWWKQKKEAIEKKKKDKRKIEKESADWMKASKDRDKKKSLSDRVSSSSAGKERSSSSRKSSRQTEKDLCLLETNFPIPWTTFEPKENWCSGIDLSSFNNINNEKGTIHRIFNSTMLIAENFSTWPLFELSTSYLNLFLVQFQIFFAIITPWKPSQALKNVF